MQMKVASSSREDRNVGGKWENEGGKWYTSQV